MSNLEQAKQLAHRSYATQLFQEMLPTGITVFVAQNPELPGCTAMGNSVAETIQELWYVREKYICHLLDHALTVPSPLRCNLSNIAGL